MSEVDGLKPLCGTAEFTAMLDSIAMENAPRLFAVVQEYGERFDGWVAAWGLAFEDRVEVLGVEDGRRISLSKAETAVRLFTVEHEHLTARLVWLSGTAPADESETAVAV